MLTTKMREHFTKVDCISFQFVYCFSPLLELIFSDPKGDNEGTKYAQTLPSHQLHWHEHIDGDLETLKSLRFPLSHSHKKEEGHKTRWQEPPLEPKTKEEEFFHFKILLSKFEFTKLQGISKRLQLEIFFSSFRTRKINYDLYWWKNHHVLHLPELRDLNGHKANDKLDLLHFCTTDVFDFIEAFQTPGHTLLTRLATTWKGQRQPYSELRVAVHNWLH